MDVFTHLIAHNLIQNLYLYIIVHISTYTLCLRKFKIRLTLTQIIYSEENNLTQENNKNN